MGILIALQHRTQYAYDRPIQLGPQILRLRPAPHDRSQIRQYALQVTPAEHHLYWFQDPFANHLARMLLSQPTREFTVDVNITLDLQAFNPFDFLVADYAEAYPFAYPQPLRRALLPYFEPEPAGPQLTCWLASIDRGPANLIGFLFDLNQQLQRDLRYELRLESGVQSCEETLSRACGSCRDSAWLLVQILRHLGLAARFVSGYLVQLAPDSRVNGTGGDDFGLHAWTEVYVPGAGWLGLDPTSGLFATEQHIPLACAADPECAAPISGSLEAAGTHFSFTHQLQRLSS